MDTFTDSDSVKGWHAHVYFDQTTAAQAKAFCEAADSRFAALKKGRFHEKLVGPHSHWSCQLAFRPELAAEVFAWLTLNRQGLTVFIHPITGDDYIDHRDRAIWMGTPAHLKLEALPRRAVVYDLLENH